MKLFLARQPIFSAKRKVFGYELLFRLGFENVFPGVDGNLATSNLMSNIFFPFDFNEILGNKKGLINFTEELILNQIPLLLPKDHFIIEVLENIEPGENIISALRALNEKGFIIALDDFVYHKKYRPMIELSQIIKFDLRATPLEDLTDIVKQIRADYDISLLAEKVETYSEFNQAKEMGFDLFQGYFFSKPEVLSTRGISSGQITKLKLLSEVHRPELNFEKVETIIKNDAAVSFKLLKFINSAYFNIKIPIHTIKEAIAYLGEKDLKTFISIIVVSDLNSQKPNELVRTSIIRAKMCEGFGRILKTKFKAEELFTLGLFSLMDAILDCKMESILSHIGFSKEMQSALLKKDKEFNLIVALIKAIERGRWQNKLFNLFSGKLVEKRMIELYLNSVKLANSFF